MAEKTADERLRDLETCLLLVYLEGNLQPFKHASGETREDQVPYYAALETALEEGKHVRLVPCQPKAPCSNDLQLTFEVDECAMRTCPQKRLAELERVLAVVELHEPLLVEVLRDLIKRADDGERAVEEAASHVYRQMQHGKHTQDREDAKTWWKRWGEKYGSPA